jgi:hypothetical protein
MFADWARCPIHSRVGLRGLPALPTNRIVAFMSTLARVALPILPLALWLSAWALPVAACTGGDAPLATGVRGATSIYYARIEAAIPSTIGFYDIRLNVGRVVRGSGRSHVVKVITPRACDELKVGDFGVVVIRSVNPYGVGPNDIYNFFYVLGPGHTSASRAAAVLSDLPATDTVSPRVDEPVGTEPWWAVLVASTVATWHYTSRKQGRLISQARVGK